MKIETAAPRERLTDRRTREMQRGEAGGLVDCGAEWRTRGPPVRRRGPRCNGRRQHEPAIGTNRERKMIRASRNAAERRKTDSAARGDVLELACAPAVSGDLDDIGRARPELDTRRMAPR